MSKPAVDRRQYVTAVVCGLMPASLWPHLSYVCSASASSGAASLKLLTPAWQMCWQALTGSDRLQSANCLLGRDGSAKLTDVGMAKIMRHKFLSTLQGQLGTFAW